MFKAWIIIRRYASVWHVLIMLIFIQVLNPWGSCLCLHSVHCVSSNSALLRQHKYFKCLPAYKSSKLNRVLWQVLSPLLPELIGTTVIYIYFFCEIALLHTELKHWYSPKWKWWALAIFFEAVSPREMWERLTWFQGKTTWFLTPIWQNADACSPKTILRSSQLHSAL